MVMLKDTIGELTVNNTGAEVMPPGQATVMLVVPGVAIRLADTDALSCVALTKVVPSAVLPQSTAAPLRNLEPFTVRVKPVPPAGTELGLNDEIVGAMRVDTLS